MMEDPQQKNEALFAKQLSHLRKQQSNHYKQAYNEEKANALKGQLKVVILPGNGDGDITDGLWYGWLQNQLESLETPIPCILENLPDPSYAREYIWKRYAKEYLFVDENTILVGHSSGAACALRLLEEMKFLGVILVSAYHSDLGDETEAKSGYFNRPFDWQKIKSNAKWILQYHSTNDRLVPIKEGEEVQREIDSVFYKMKLGHFQMGEFPDIVKKITNMLKN
eukprot:TRINITY_DN5321_c0_g1_i5.p1 TRINITY_DN5321_c0_g1~~TRINITY_DN5321_c0_g1_i5.p1  ORF type:complete len:224 (+),score=50.59 TRINITY_DN5321_c0_g1_i5:196-867(+)